MSHLCKSDTLFLYFSISLGKRHYIAFYVLLLAFDLRVFKKSLDVSLNMFLLNQYFKIRSGLKVEKTLIRLETLATLKSLPTIDIIS